MEWLVMRLSEQVLTGCKSNHKLNRIRLQYFKGFSCVTKTLIFFVLVQMIWLGTAWGVWRVLAIKMTPCSGWFTASSSMNLLNIPRRLGLCHRENKVSLMMMENSSSRENSCNLMTHLQFSLYVVNNLHRGRNNSMQGTR